MNAIFSVESIFIILIVLMSVVLHEVAHGYMALRFGDTTARDMGRLTLNPISHLDLFGSIILPIFLYIASGFTFGYAKPVPFNPDNFREKKRGTIAVASAGVLANFIIALFFGLFLRFAPPEILSFKFRFLLEAITVINLSLAIFNLVPIPPLDGSKIFFNLLPNSFSKIISFIEQYSLIIFLIFIFMFSKYLSLPVYFLFNLIVGGMS